MSTEFIDIKPDPSTMPQDGQAVTWHCGEDSEIKHGVFSSDEEMFCECPDPLNPGHSFSDWDFWWQVHSWKPFNPPEKDDYWTKRMADAKTATELTAKLIEEVRRHRLGKRPTISPDYIKEGSSEIRKKRKQ